MTKKPTNKYKLLLASIALDGIGMLSYLIPGIGAFSDIIWAPLSGWIMTRMYKGTAGQVGGVIAFIEELMPGLDIVPTFTLMWLYTFVFKGAKAEKVIEIKE